MTQEPRQSGGDLVGELQRWLVRSGARGVSRELSGQLRTALGGGRSRADVWETATSEHGEAPECAWCPICRARRRLRDSGPGLASGVAAAADAVNVVMQDAIQAFEAAVAAAGRQARVRSEPRPAGEVWDEATDEPAGRAGGAQLQAVPAPADLPAPGADAAAPDVDPPAPDADLTAPDPGETRES